MRIKQSLIIITIILIGQFKVAAQLSTRTNDSTVIRTGTRPESGDFAFFLSTSYQEIEDMTDNNIEVTGIPLVNVKYYITDELVVGLGIQTYKSRKYINGVLPEDETGTTTDITTESRNIFSPRAEYHFSDKNILDAYVGMEIPVGWEKDIVEFGEKYTITGDYSNELIEKSSFLYGFSLFAGTQAFIADLPMAIGVEIGIRGFGYGDMTYMHEENYSINGVESSQTFYTTGNEDYTTYTEYDELEYKKFELGSDLRITFNYFFSR